MKEDIHDQLLGMAGRLKEYAQCWELADSHLLKNTGFGVSI